MNIKVTTNILKSPFESLKNNFEEYSDIENTFKPLLEQLTNNFKQ